MQMKMTFVEPELDVLRIETEDVLATSNPEIELPMAPA